MKRLACCIALFALGCVPEPDPTSGPGPGFTGDPGTGPGVPAAGCPAGYTRAYPSRFPTPTPGTTPTTAGGSGTIFSPTRAVPDAGRDAGVADAGVMAADAGAASDAGMRADGPPMDAGMETMAVDAGPTLHPDAGDSFVTDAGVRCVRNACSSGQVAVEDPRSFYGTPNLICASPPPYCGPTLWAQYSLSGRWDCTDCSVVIHYGALFGGVTRCAPPPSTVQCTGGEVPTFDAMKEQWLCAPKCNNVQYDQVMLGGMLVCIPC